MRKLLHFRSVDWSISSFLLTLFAFVLSPGAFAQVTLGTSPYTQNFDAGTLPTGWTTRTGAGSAALGSNVTPLAATSTAAALSWASSSGNFRFAASAKAPLTSTSNQDTQKASSDRSLSIRATNDFGDTGSSFNLQLANTLGKTNLSLTFSAQLQNIQSRTTTWAVQYGTGTNPASYTQLTTFTDQSLNGGAWGVQPITVNFGSALDNLTGNVWIRIISQGSTGSGSRCTFGIDDVSLSFQNLQATPTTTSITPSSATAGDAGFTLTVNGTNFVSGSSSVTWNGAARTTTFVSATELTASISAADISAVGSYAVGVTTTGAAAASNTQTFTVNAPATPNLAITGTTAHGSVCPGTAATSLQYTITNSGLSAANNLSVVSDNPDFVVSGLSATSVAGSNGTVTFNVTFTPATAGSKTATITVNSLTAGANSPTIGLTGTGITPVAVSVSTVSANGISNTVATLRGNLATLGVCPATTQKGFVYSLTSANSNPEHNGASVTTQSVIGLVTGAFNLPLSSLAPNTSYSFKAYAFDGTTYTYGTLETFSTLAAANQLAFVGVPTTGNATLAVQTFTVEARRPDNSIDTNFTGTVTLTKASGPGVLSGTLSVAAVNGVATFSTVTFGSAGTYTLHADAGTLAQATSGNIVISLTPVSIFANPITGSNPGQTSPYTNGQTVDANLTVSGIVRGPGLSGADADNRYSATSFSIPATLDQSDYFEFRLTPTPGHKINFSELQYTSQRSTTGPQLFALRSSVDNFSQNIATPTNTGGTFSLSAFQNVQSEITFRLYGYNATSATGTFSVNDFTFKGNILCADPQVFNVTGGGATCGSNGLAIGLSDSQQGFSYQLLRDGNNVGSAVAGTGDAISFESQSVAGTYTVRATNSQAGCDNVIVMNGSAVISLSNTNTWVGTVDKNWQNAANWSCNTVPTASSDVVINIPTPGGVEITSTAFANSLTISNGALLTILSGHDLTVTDVVNSTGGNLTVANNANLIQINDVDNSGIAKVRRNSSALIRQDYTLWSSPVSGQDLLAFSSQTLTNRFYTYNSATNAYVSVAEPNTTEFAEGQGYLIRLPNNHPTTPTIWAGEFNGTPRNGNISVALNNGGEGFRFNAVGNPYPSAVNMFTFASDNQANITGTLYFWRKTNNAASPSYSTWTAGGGFLSNGEAQNVNPNGILRTGQGFIVEASATGTELVFNNAQRSGDNANQFFRQNQEMERHRVWLNATNATGAFSQALVGYIEGSTLGNDAHIDGKYFNDGEIALYSLIEGERFGIQGRPLPFEDTDVVPMGFKATVAGSYAIAIDHMDGLFLEGQDVFLRDNLTGTIHDLNDGAYTFVSEAATFNTRFEVVYQNALSVDNPSFNPNSVIVYKRGNGFVVNSGNIEMSAIQVFDVLGKRVYEHSDINASETFVPATEANQVLIFKIKASTQAEVTKKVVN
ncbi:hypothetical protein [Flavobacterium selenitireducens]|uniref:hypothetical protein n=1 Tax=Flavobacterium selenitireducens TaxID=2722704 RepID=UPI00168BC1C1|nr:hypothetical protein [Flavobacterium selenitireducens]MBD3582698.1 hypothetical protein [Flavobacterium selenitireducens]